MGKIGDFVSGLRTPTLGDVAKTAAEVALVVVAPQAAVVKAAVDAFTPAPAPGAQPAPPPPPPDPLRGISAEQRTRLNDAASGKQGPQAQAAAQTLIAQAQVLPEDTRVKVLNLASRDLAGKDGEALTKILASPAFLSGTPEQRRQLIDVASVAGPGGLQALATLSADKARLQDKDSKGKSLLDNLAQLANQPLNAALQGPGKMPRQQLVDTTLANVATPATSIQQGSANTCVPTSMEFELARANPGEYARIMAGLTSTEGKVELRGGEKMELKPDYLFEGAATKGRDAASFIFQGSAMELANGSDKYDDFLDEHTAADGKTRQGLNGAEGSRLGAQLFGKEYVSRSIGPQDRDKLVEVLPDYPPNPPVVLCFKTGGKLDHACTFEKIENGRVYFRNPVGAPNSDEMKAWDKRGARVENGQSGEWSMSVADFKKSISSVTGPGQAS